MNKLVSSSLASTALVSGSLASFLLLAFVPACGGSDSNGAAPTTSEIVAACKKTCSKEVSCMADAGPASGLLDCDVLCDPDNFKPHGSSQQNSDCDYDAWRSKLDECANVACSELEACEKEASAVCSPSNGGGAGGSANQGAGGSANQGAGGGTQGGLGETCAICAKAETCCEGMPQTGGTSCSQMSQSACEGQSANVQPAFIQACIGMVQGGLALGVAACK